MGFYQCCIQVFVVLSVLLSVAVTLWGGYHVAVALMSWRVQRTYPRYDPKNRFAVLIAARNEEVVIGGLVKSLLEQEYPSRLYDVIVIPNNCTDSTAQVAQEAGARILECTDPVKSKGEVLRFAIDRLLREEYDAFCVFDADNIVDRNFLAEMNNALCSGVRVAQGYRDSKNPHDTAISGCYSIYYWMMDRFYNRGKSACGLSALVNGTGFMVSRPVLEKLGGWNTRTISEDLEITVQCTLQGETVAWVPEAVTYDEQPLSFGESVKQRKRWSSGTLQVSDRYLPRVWHRLRRGVRSPLADLLVTLMVPAYQAVAAVSMVLGAVAAGFGDVPYRFTALGFLGALGLSLATMMLTSAGLALLVTALEGRLSRKMWKGILLYGFFLLSWIPITFYCMFHRTTQWEQIKHTRNVAVVPLRNLSQTA